MKTAYRSLSMLVALGVVVQAAAIAYAWFAVIKDLDGGTVLDENYEGNVGHALHGITGMMIIPALGLLLLVVSFFTKVDGAVKWAAAVFGLVVLQVALAFVSFGAPVVGALHGINALALAGVAGMAARVVREGRPRTAASPADTVPAV